jgi:hypothetical protein
MNGHLRPPANLPHGVQLLVANEKEAEWIFFYHLPKYYNLNIGNLFVVCLHGWG